MLVNHFNNWVRRNVSSRKLDTMRREAPAYIWTLEDDGRLVGSNEYAQQIHLIYIPTSFVFEEGMWKALLYYGWQRIRPVTLYYKTNEDLTQIVNGHFDDMRNYAALQYNRTRHA